MTSSFVLSITTFIYGLAVILYAAGVSFKRELPAKAATITTWIAVLANLAGILLRWLESHQLGYGHAPLTNLYESLIFFAFATGVVYLGLEIKFKTRGLGAAAVLISFIALAYASLGKGMDQEIQPLIPALQSNWLSAHVMTCFLGYAAFAIAFGISVVYLIVADQVTEDDTAGGPATSGIYSLLPPADVLEELIYQTVVFGFFFLSMGIITGAVWANTAWGRYWGWDPKETWSLITWFVYATMLHVRLMRNWTGKRIAWFAIAGFAAVLFTYFGVNLLPGLHSYQ
ncbi:MAG: c-type cytochrome biogenesis protein CcsB [Thermodesulfobacteriota bacterium]|nr:c-type cytochrome biogenesis protein CcsB [Thermodesulfobacteriota bacterium]